MGYLETWGAHVDIAAAALAVVFIPGLLCLKALRARTSIALALGPAWSMALVGGASIVFPFLGIRWNLASFSVFLAMSVGVCLLIGRSFSKVAAGSRPAPYSHVSHGYLGGVAFVVLVACLYLILPVAAPMPPEFPSSFPDAMYHYNGVRNIAQTGNASLIGAMDANYGLHVGTVVYPSVWHAMVSLFSAQDSIVVASHIVAVVVVPVVWTVGIAALAIAAFPTTRIPGLLAPGIALVFPVFPQYLTVSKAFWPNSISLAVLPSILAIGVLAYHRLRWAKAADRRGILLLTAPLLGVAIVGASAAHPSMLYSLIWVMLPSALSLGVWWLRRVTAGFSARRTVLTFATIGIGVLTILALLLSQPRVASYMRRESSLDWDDPFKHLGSTIVLWPIGDNVVVNSALVLSMLSATVFGMHFAMQRRHTRWLVYGWLIQAALIAGSYFPLDLLSSFAGLWYHDTYRLFSVQVVFSAMLFALAGAHVIDWATLRARKERDVRHRVGGFAVGLPAAIGVSCAVVALGVTTVVRGPTVYADAEPLIGEDAIIGSRAEFEMLKSLDDHVPDGAVIIGDPLTGVAFAPPLSDVNSVYSQVNLRGLDSDGNFLLQAFRDIHSDPRVCQILSHYGIGFYYEDESITYRSTDRQEVMPGFYAVDTREGFTLIEEAGTAKLWQIDGCGPMESSIGGIWLHGKRPCWFLLSVWSRSSFGISSVRSKSERGRLGTGVSVPQWRTEHRHSLSGQQRFNNRNDGRRLILKRKSRGGEV